MKTHKKALAPVIWLLIIALLAGNLTALAADTADEVIIDAISAVRAAITSHGPIATEPRPLNATQAQVYVQQKIVDPVIATIKIIVGATASSLIGTVTTDSFVAAGNTAGSYTFTVNFTCDGAGPVLNNPFTETIPIAAVSHVPVTGITGVPTAAVVGTPLTLTGTVTPANATNKDITWSVVNAGTTGAAIANNILTTTAAGTVTVRATVANGKAVGTPYTQDFTITVASNDTDTLAAVINWLTWERIRSGNASALPGAGLNTASNRYQVTANLLLQLTVPETLPLDAKTITTGSVTIAWSANPSGYINTSSGAVTFPTSGAGQQVTLTAVVKSNNTTANVDFYLTLLPSPDQAVVNEAMDWLVWNQIRRHNDASTSAFGPYPALSDLSLPASYTNADNKTVAIRWSTSNSGVVTADGAVNPPASGTASVSLTAVFTYGSITSTVTANNPNTKVFNLSVRRPTDAEAVRMAKEWLTWDVIRDKNVSQSAVASALSLKTAGEYGTTITWSSSNPSVIANNGAITFPASGSVTVALTALVIKGTSSDTKSFTLIVGQPAFTISKPAGGGEVAEMPADHFNKLCENGTKGFVVEMSFCKISFDAAAAKTLNDRYGDLAISAGPADRSGLSPLALAAVGARPVYEFTVKAGNSLILYFNGTVSVNLPYSPAWGEDPNAIIVYRLNEITGELQAVRSYYDQAAGGVRFATNSFSKYVIGYAAPAAFKDQDQVDAAWGGGAKQHITFVASRRLFSGYDDGSYGPGDTMTRAQFVAVLRNFDGADLSQAKYASNRFTDGSGWYARVLAWGDEAGVYGNYTSAEFRPEAPVTRADMAYMLYNYAIRNNIALNQIRTLSFSDIGGLSYDYQTAILTLACAGVISGNDGRYNPDGQSTRAEVAAIIAMFVRAFTV